MNMTKKTPGRPAIYPFRKLEKGVGEAVRVAIDGDVRAFTRVRSAAHVYASNRGWKVTTELKTRRTDEEQYVRVLRVA